MAARGSLALLLLSLAVGSSPAGAQGLYVYYDGLLDVRCENEPLSNVFERIEQEVGLSLILEPAVAATTLSATFERVPVAMAVQRLLEGKGVVYAVMMDRREWGRVDKVFVGAGGGGPARQAPPPRPALQAPEADEVFDELEDELDDFNAMDDFDDDGLQDQADPAQLAPPAASPAPSYLPPQQSFPRSRFTPGPPGGDPSPNAVGAQPPTGAFPLTDAFGRPIRNQGQPPPQQPDPRQR